MNRKEIAKQVAAAGLPTLGTILAGPLGGTAGALVAKTLGLGGDAPVGEVLARLGNPEALVALKQVEADLAKATLEYEGAAYATEVEDRKSAREQLHDSRVPAYLTAALVAMVALFAAALIFLPIPADNQRILDTTFGALLGGFTTSIAYWLGSSRGSAVKTLQQKG